MLIRLREWFVQWSVQCFTAAGSSLLLYRGILPPFVEFHFFDRFFLFPGLPFSATHGPSVVHLDVVACFLEGSTVSLAEWLKRPPGEDHAILPPSVLPSGGSFPAREGCHLPLGSCQCSVVRSWRWSTLWSV